LTQLSFQLKIQERGRHEIVFVEELKHPIECPSLSHL
jgi:hypothetical protein